MNRSIESPPRIAHPGRALVAALAAAALGGGAWLLWNVALPRIGLLAAALLERRTPPLPVVAAGGCGLALLGCAVWLLLTVLATAVDVVRERRGRASCLALRLGCPRLVRVVVVAALGMTYAGPALATTDGAHSGSGRIGLALEGLGLPERVETPLAAPPPAPTGADGLRGRLGPHVVRPGESLWSITAARLPHETDAAAVDVAWRALAAANADRLGPDPDLIFPGTPLRVPPDWPAWPDRARPSPTCPERTVP